MGLGKDWAEGGVMVNVVCQRDGVTGCPGSCINIISRCVYEGCFQNRSAMSQWTQ